jgi:hypothetical protein
MGSDDVVNVNRRVLLEALQFFRGMDDMVVEACQDATRRGLHPRVSETDLQILRNAHAYQNADHNVEDLVNYFAGIRHSKPIWDAALRSVGVWLVDSGVQQYRKQWVTHIQNYGSQAWRAAAPTSSILAQHDGKESINAIIDKFATLDTLLDQVYPDVNPGVERERFSDEFRDTM